VSIVIPIDWHAETPPPPPLGADWMAQMPREIAAEHPAQMAFLGDWRAGPRKRVDADILRGVAPKELRRAEVSGADQDAILDLVARFWVAAEKHLDLERPTALLLWNCGNADQNLWAKLAGEHHIPIMHCEHGWLPQTRIFDPVGGYVTGRCEWDVLPSRPAGECLGAAIIRLWRKARLSKHQQGGRPSERTQEFCGTGPALLVAMQLEADGAAVYHETEFDCQRDLIRRCLSWPGPVVVKRHPQAERIEWEPEFAEQRRLCQMEVEAKGGMWLDANESIHELLPIVSAVAAINSNLLLEAAMSGRLALSFGHGPHSGRGLTVDMRAGDSWPVGEQTPEQWAAVCKHVGSMEAYLSPEGAWLPDWDRESFWGFPFWENAQAALAEKWRRLLSKEN